MKICARFIEHTFSCMGELHPQLHVSYHPLANYISYIMRRTKTTYTVLFTALYYLQRLKQARDAARACTSEQHHVLSPFIDSGRHLFIVACMIASKIICDSRAIYPNKIWASKVAREPRIALKDLNALEYAMCTELGWALNVDGYELSLFKQHLRREYGGLPPYPASGAAQAQTPVVDQHPLPTPGHYGITQSPGGTSEQIPCATSPTSATAPPSATAGAKSPGEQVAPMDAPQVESPGSLSNWYTMRANPTVW